MEPNEQPYDYRWHHQQNARRSCMERPQNTWPKEYEPRAFAPNNFQPKLYENRYDYRGTIDLKQLLNPTGKMFDGQEAKTFMEGDKFPDERGSPVVDPVIDPISHSASPSPLPQQVPATPLPALQFVTLPPPDHVPAHKPLHGHQLEAPPAQPQVVLVIKDGQVMTPANVQASVQPITMETLSVDANLKVEDLPLEEQLSPSMILEHAEVDDEESEAESESGDGEVKSPEPDDDFDPKDEEFVLENLKNTDVADMVEDGNIRRSNRKRRTTTYSEEFDLDLDLDNDDLGSPEKNNAERKKRKSSKPVKVTENADDWMENEEGDSETASSKKRKNLLKRGSYSWKKTNVWFGREKMLRYQRLKERGGFKSECVLINRMLNLMEKSVNEGEQNTSVESTEAGKKISNNANKRAGRSSIHNGESTDQFGNVVSQTEDDAETPDANLCLRVSPEVRRNWFEMMCQTKMTPSALLTGMMLAYQKEKHVELPRYQILAKEQDKHPPSPEQFEICACPPTEDNSEDGTKKKKKKTKEVENIEDEDFIAHQVQDASTNNSIDGKAINKVLKFYECAICHKVFKSLNVFYHLRTHKKQDYACTKCGKQVPIRQPKRSRQATKCIYCDFTSHYKPMLRNHYKEAHPSQCKPGQHYMCDICPKKFKSAASLRDHRSTHMPDKFGFQCDICKKFFGNRRFLRVHMHGVHGSKNHVCTEEGCTRAFNTKNMLNTHIKRVHLKVRKVECPLPECKKLFFSKCELAQHTRVYHTKEKCFVCEWDGCGKTFRAPYHLQVHMRIHTDTKPLKCPHCDYRARQRNALNWHLRKHGEGPHFDKLTKPTKPKTQKTQKAAIQPQPPQENPVVATRPMAAILDEHVGEIPMYTPQFTNFDFQSLQHHPNPFHGMELYHPQMPAFPQAIPQGSSHAPMQYQTL